jgi:hypothetical protein
MSSSSPGSPTEPEYLGDSPSEGRRGPRRGVVLGLAAAGVVGVVAAGSWAAVSFLSTGSQPAEAVPADALAYVSIDLDPSAGQKLEAVRIAQKFPALEQELGLDATDDLRRWVFDEAGLADCDGVTYEDDVESWIGERAAIAVLPADQDGEPRPIVALAVSDEDTAATKLEELSACSEAEGSEEPSGFAVGDGYAVLAETDQIAQGALEDAASATLAEDATFQRWTEEAGDPGIVTLYVAPEALDAMADLAASEAPGSGLDPSVLKQMSEDFGGMAGVVRFDGGAVEAEFAGSGLPEGSAPREGAVTDVASLPASTGAAYAIAFQEGWLEPYLDSLGAMSGMGADADQMLAEAEAATGLSLPEDIETLLGHGVAVALDADLDAQAIADGQDPSTVPAGIRIQGDPAEILPVVDKIRTALGPAASMLVVEQGEGTVALGLNQSYVQTLTEEGALGDEAVFEDAVPEADRSGAVLFVNFDAGDGWVERLVADIEQMSGGDAGEARENIAPLQAVGISAWSDGDVARGLFRLTTD